MLFHGWGRRGKLHSAHILFHRITQECGKHNRRNVYLMEINFFSLTQSESLHPLGTDFPRAGGKCRAAPDEGDLGQNAVVLRPHQSPAVTAAPLFVTFGDISPRPGRICPFRGKPSCGKLISMRLPSGLQNKKDVLPCGNTSFFIASVSGEDQLTAGGRQRPEPCRARCPRTS